MIYFVLDTVVRAIKIGYSEKPKKRLGALQTANPNKLDILGTIPGTEKDEEQLHIKFGQHRLQGEWFKGDEIFEAVMEIITASKNLRTVRQVSRNMSENPETPDMSASVPTGSSPAVDPDSKMEGISRIPGLKMTKFTLKLTERQGQENHDKGTVYCGYEIKYVLIFEKNATYDELSKLRVACCGQYPSLQHYFIDADDAIIPFVQSSDARNGVHVYGGQPAIMGLEGLGFRVFVLNEQPFRTYHNFDVDTYYPGEHPLKKAKRFVAHIPGYGEK